MNFDSFFTVGGYTIAFAIDLMSAVGLLFYYQCVRPWGSRAREQQQVSCLVSCSRGAINKLDKGRAGVLRVVSSQNAVANRPFLWLQTWRRAASWTASSSAPTTKSAFRRDGSATAAPTARTDPTSRTTAVSRRACAFLYPATKSLD